MKRLLGLLVVIIASFAAGWLFKPFFKSGISPSNPLSPAITKPLEKYTIENLSNTKIKEGQILLQETLEEEEGFTSYLFSFTFNPNLDDKTLKQTTGQINMPAGDGPFPVVLMLRGYIDQEIYKTGDGTRKAAAVFAKNGYITIAPDFLGYAGSDKEAENIFETRFQTYTTVLSLLKSLEKPSLAMQKGGLWDSEKIFIWGHSNGGQIALTILEITGKGYPTTLWAPVSKPFPYSVLFYTDEAEDRGKLIRREIAKFEELYNPDLYSIDLYFNRINSKLQIQQGTADESVPVSWSNELVKSLGGPEIDVTYYKYPDANHNMVPSWNTVVARDLAFFDKHLKNN